MYLWMILRWKLGSEVIIKYGFNGDKVWRYNKNLIWPFNPLQIPKENIILK